MTPGIRERTGIARRHLAENETTSYMAAEAAKRALAQSDIPAEDVDLILVATSTPENVFPCHWACEVQREIHAEHAAGFDLNAACSGFFVCASDCTGVHSGRNLQDSAGDRCGQYVTYGGLE